MSKTSLGTLYFYGAIHKRILMCFESGLIPYYNAVRGMFFIAILQRNRRTYWYRPNLEMLGCLLIVGHEKTRHPLQQQRRNSKPGLWVLCQGLARMAYAAAEASLGMQKLLQGWISRCFLRVI